jgi:hypothetical protein
MRKTKQRTPNRIFFAAMLVIAGTVTLAPGCELDVGDDELAALEEQAAAEAGDVSPTNHEGPGTTTSNWWLGSPLPPPGTPRGAEQGVHGWILPGDCAAGSAVIGVQYFEGGNSDWADGIGVACWGPNVGYTFFNWYLPGAIRTGEQGTHGQGMGLCDWGDVVTGVQYFDINSDLDWVDGLGVECGSPRESHNWFWDTVIGDQGDHQVRGLDCPNGLVVVGLQAFEGTTPGTTQDWLDAIAVHCGPLPAGWPTTL